MLQLLYQFLMAQLCRTFVITLWIVNCQSSKCPPLART